MTNRHWQPDELRDVEAINYRASQAGLAPAELSRRLDAIGATTPAPRCSGTPAPRRIQHHHALDCPQRQPRRDKRRRAAGPPRLAVSLLSPAHRPAQGLPCRSPRRFRATGWGRPRTHQLSPPLAGSGKRRAAHPAAARQPHRAPLIMPHFDQVEAGATLLMSNYPGQPAATFAPIRRCLAAASKGVTGSAIPRSIPRAILRHGRRPLPPMIPSLGGRYAPVIYSLKNFAFSGPHRLARQYPTTARYRQLK